MIRLAVEYPYTANFWGSLAYYWSSGSPKAVQHFQELVRVLIRVHLSVVDLIMLRTQSL